MRLTLLEEELSVLKLSPAHPIPSWALSGNLHSITRTDEELSIVCPTEQVLVTEEVLAVEHEWKCIKIEGPLDFSLIGIMASISTTLAEKSISIFALSTFNTDYLLVKKGAAEKAVHALKEAGHTFEDSSTG